MLLGGETDEPFRNIDAPGKVVIVAPAAVSSPGQWFPGTVRSFTGASPRGQCLKRNYYSARPEQPQIAHTGPVKSSAVALKVVIKPPLLSAFKL